MKNCGHDWLQAVLANNPNGGAPRLNIGCPHHQHERYINNPLSVRRERPYTNPVDWDHPLAFDWVLRSKNNW